MSSDPIEVLRERLRDYAEGLAAPVTLHAEDVAELTALIRDALASLSAPKPPPMNDNAVAVNESAPVNSKPESAEAVGEAGTLPGSNGGFTTAVFKASEVPVGTKLYTAPPRPEASAPVGVEGLVVAAKAAESMLRTVHECASHECEDCREYAGISAKWLRDALAGQQQGGPQE